jgi:predicted nucleotidyltransferase
MASKLKGVRGLGGQEGLVKILGVLQEQGMVEFIDNGKEVRMNDEHPLLARLKSLVALCDLEDLLSKLRPVCTKAIFFGSRATGKAHSSSNYDLYVVTTDPAAAQLAVQGHPLAKDISLKAMTPEEDSALEKQDPKLASSLIQGMMLWGPSW